MRQRPFGRLVRGPRTATGMRGGLTHLVPTLTDATSYSHDVDLTSLSASAYRVVSGDVRSNAVAASSCGPGTTIPEAPAALLLPLSLLGLLGLAGGGLYLRRRTSS